jgi:hypothetical protein
VNDILLHDVFITAVGNVVFGGFIIIVVWRRRARPTIWSWLMWLVGVVGFASGVTLLVAIALGLPVLGH